MIKLIGFSVKTVYKYISALRKLHDLITFDSSVLRSSSQLEAWKKTKRHIPLRKVSITSVMLLKFRSQLDFRKSANLFLWAALPLASSRFFEPLTYVPSLEKYFFLIFLFT